MQSKTAMPRKGSWGKKPIAQIVVNNLERRDEEKRTLCEAMLVGKNKDWVTLIEKGLSCPAIMDRLCASFYRHLPNEYKYILPVKWYMNGGKIADSVLQAMTKARLYRPEEWTGKELLKNGSGLDVYIGTRANIDEAGKLIAWTTSYNSAYVTAQMISGRVYRAFLNASDIIAIDENSVDNVLQYDSVTGIEQVFPKLPVSLI